MTAVTDKTVLKSIQVAGTKNSNAGASWVVMLFLITALGLLTVAYAQAELVERQYELDRLRYEFDESTRYRDRLSKSVDEASAPQTVVGRAEEMGMVRAIGSVYLVATTQLASSELNPEIVEPEGDQAGYEIVAAGVISDDG